MAADLVSGTYASVLILGGIIGYLKAGSVISMLMGTASGLLMFYGAYQTSKDSSNITLSLVVSALLLCLMGYRFMGSFKFFPAGFVALLSLLMVLRFSVRAVYG